MTGIPRRTVLAGGAGLAGGALLGAPGESGTPAEAAGRSRSRAVALNQGTDIAARLSPDGRTIALDLVGVLWLLPAPGGPARRLTGDFLDIAQPDWSPRGDTLVFHAYRAGSFDLWSIRADGSRLRQLTRGPFDHREPRFAPDGGRVAFSSDLSGTYGIHLLDPATGAVTALADGSTDEYEPAWSPDGRRVAFVVANTRIDVVEVA